MILALNANAALDRVIFIDRFTPGETMRTRREVDSVGGKGLDIAQVLASLGAQVQALSFIAGENGRLLERLFVQRHIPAELIWVEGETRVIYVIVETEAANRHSHITLSGYAVTADQCQQYLVRVARLASQAQWALIGGSLPDGAPSDFYRQVIDRLHANFVQSLIDCFGAPARAALDAAPDILKMNQSEFFETFGQHPNSPSEWMAAYHELKAIHGVANLVITCGADGILAFTATGAYQAHSPVQKEVNAAGSGDAASAALVLRLSHGDDWPGALRWAAAAGAAAVLTEGTAECRPEDVARLLPHVEVIPLKIA